MMRFEDGLPGEGNITPVSIQGFFRTLCGRTPLRDLTGKPYGFDGSGSSFPAPCTASSVIFFSKYCSTVSPP